MGAWRTAAPFSFEPTRRSSRIARQAKRLARGLPQKGRRRAHRAAASTAPGVPLKRSDWRDGRAAANRSALLYVALEFLALSAATSDFNGAMSKAWMPSSCGCAVAIGSSTAAARLALARMAPSAGPPGWSQSQQSSLSNGHEQPANPVRIGRPGALRQNCAVRRPSSWRLMMSPAPRSWCARLARLGTTPHPARP